MGAAIGQPVTRGDRLFIAAPLPEADIESLTARLPPIPGRRVVPEKWHFTLRFLGDTAPSTRERIVREMQLESYGDRFTVHLSGLGAFPKPIHARVVWIGVTDGADRLSALAGMVEHACARAGVRGDERPYSPHLTVSRLDPPRDLRPFLDAHSGLSFATSIEEVTLMRSTLGRGPSRYEPVARFPLTSAG